MKKNIKLKLLILGLTMSFVTPISAFASAEESLQQVSIDKFERGLQYYDMVGSMDKDNLEFFDNLQEIDIEHQNQVKFHLSTIGNYYGVVSGDTLQDFKFSSLKSPDGKYLTPTGAVPTCSPDIKEKLSSVFDLNSSSDPKGHFAVCSLEDAYIQKFYIFLLPEKFSKVGDWTLIVQDNGILAGGDEKPTFINDAQTPFFHQAHQTGSTISLEVSKVKSPDQTGILSGSFNAIVNKDPSNSMFEVNLKKDDKVVDDASISLQTDFGTTVYFQENPNVPGNYVAKVDIKTTQFLNELSAKRYLLIIENNEKTYYSWVKL